MGVFLRVLNNTLAGKQNPPFNLRKNKRQDDLQLTEKRKKANPGKQVHPLTNNNNSVKNTAFDLYT